MSFPCPSCGEPVEATRESDWVCAACGEVHLGEGPAGVVDPTNPVLDVAEFAARPPRAPHAPILARLIAGAIVVGSLYLGFAAVLGLLSVGPFKSLRLDSLLIFAPLGACGMVLGISLWKGRAWSWWVYVFLQALGGMLSFFSALLGDAPAIGRLAIACLILVYMTRPRVRAFYGLVKLVPVPLG